MNLDCPEKEHLAKMYCLNLEQFVSHEADIMSCSQIYLFREIISIIQDQRLYYTSFLKFTTKYAHWKFCLPWYLNKNATQESMFRDNWK